MQDLPKFEDWQLQLEAELKQPTKPTTSPAHYQRLNPQPIQVIEWWGLGFHAANVLKYLSRAGHKGGPANKVEDLKKARFYLDRLIAQAEQETK